MMIGFAKPIAVGKGFGEAAVIGVMAITICNSFGRLFWGTISDKLGRINTIIVLLVGTAILSFFVLLADGYLIFVLIGGIGFFYGGFLSSFPSLTADYFGPKHMSTNYGFVLIGLGVASVVSSQIAGHYKNLATQNIELMSPAFVIAAVCAIGGVALILVVKKIAGRLDQT
jgi:OFA family oxalate/formate antiporter-like MFS transporter